MENSIPDLERVRLLAQQLARITGAEVSVSVTFRADPDGETSELGWCAVLPRHVGPKGRFLAPAWLETTGPAFVAVNRLLILCHEHRYGRSLRKATTTAPDAGKRSGSGLSTDAGERSGSGSGSGWESNAPGTGSNPELVDEVDFRYDRSTNEVDLSGPYEEE